MNLPNRHYLLHRKYQLTQVVGQGGFGITYQGVWFTEVKGPLGTMKTDVPVCIKEYFFKDYCYRDKKTFEVCVHSETGKLLFYKFNEKLIREARILSDVHHSHIVNVLDVFEENNTAYIAMEYIPGCSLKYMLDKEGILPERKVLKYIHQIGRALHFVHEKNILHLDIKPSNILIDRNDTARLIDFGVSKRYDIEQQETSTTMLTLSKGFASIEQYDDEGTQIFSPCPDVYSLGATLYNLLTGKIPVESILRATKVLEKPSAINPAISANTEKVILKAMEVIPANRYQTVAEMLADLEEPPIEENAINPYVESNTQQEDSTILLKEGTFSSGQDDEQTLLVSPAPVYSAKKKRKGVLITGLICLFVVAASAMVMLVTQDKPSDLEEPDMLAEVLPSGLHEEIDLPGMENDSPEEETSSNIAAIPSTIREENNLAPVIPVPLEREDKPEEDPVPVEDDSGEILSQNEIDTRYAEWVASGNRKMEAEDYPAAREDYIMAKELKVTEEIVRLIVTSEEKMEEQELINRLSGYEEKLALGTFKIVRKKSSGRYGAIDENGIEYIPCKYINVDKADNGRAFERDDNLFDVYNEQGVLIKEGVTYY